MRGEETYLEERIHEALTTDGRVAEPELDVRLAGGRVFVRGTVPSVERRRAIDAVIRERFPGLEVVNETSVLPPTPKGEEEQVR
ncbi:MAG TPA: BON domain-containing protein [Actinomycetota bacterium]|nr:BON domain-containing protein [Actinomycetota bacterium]